MRRNSVYLGFIIVGAFAGERVRSIRKKGLPLARFLLVLHLTEPRPAPMCVAVAQWRCRFYVGVEQQGGEYYSLSFTFTPCATHLAVSCLTGFWI